MRYKITSCIVMYENNVEILQKSIDSFLNTSFKVKLFLIDNSPTDYLRKLDNDDRIEYRHNPSNPGFGAAHNIAIKEALCSDSEYHIVLNPDIYFEKGTIEGVIDFMDKNKEFGQLLPKVTYPSEEIQYLCKRNPTFFDLFARGFMPNVLRKIFKKRLDKYEYKDYDYDKIIYDIPYLSGCFMLIRTSVFKKVGFFDDKIFMYLEDADLTRRILEVSRTIYYPNERIYHHFAKLTHKEFKFKWITIESAFIYFRKWGWFKHII